MTAQAASDADAPSAKRFAIGHPGRSWLMAVVSWLLVWGGITFWRSEVLWLPPYYEYAMGLFTEASFLADSDFDYPTLRHEVPRGNEGGPYCYMTSVLPTLLAVVMRATSTPEQTFLVGHLFTFACAAGIACMFWSLAAPRTGQWMASLLAAAMLTVPVFRTQIDMIGMDLPLTTCAMATVWSVARGYFTCAALAATAAFLMKPTGMVVSLALICYFIAAVILALGKRGDSRRYALALVCALVAFGLQVLIYRLGGIHERLTGSRGSTNLLIGSFLVCPDLFLLATILTPLALIQVVHGYFRQFRVSQHLAGTTRWLEPVRVLCFQHPAICYGLILLPGLFTAIGFYGYVAPQYYALALPFGFLLVGGVLSAWRWLAVVSVPAIACLVLFNLANWDGRFFPPLNEIDQWSRGGYRSGAYLADHLANIAAMQKLEALADGTPVVTGWPFSYYLNNPRLGYVKRPLKGYTTKPLWSEHFRDIRQLFVDLPDEIILIHQNSAHYAYAWASIPLPAADDEIINDDRLPSPTIIYRKELKELAPTKELRSAWLLEHLWYDPSLDGRPGISHLNRAALLEAYGRPDLAAQLAELAMADHPDDVALAQQAKVWRRKADRLEATEKALRIRIDSNAGDTAARCELAALLADRHEIRAAIEQLRAALAADPNCVEAQQALGPLLMEQGHTEQERRQPQTP